MNLLLPNVEELKALFPSAAAFALAGGIAAAVVRRWPALGGFMAAAAFGGAFSNIARSEGRLLWEPIQSTDRALWIIASTGAFGFVFGLLSRSAAGEVQVAQNGHPLRPRWRIALGTLLAPLAVIAAYLWLSAPLRAQNDPLNSLDLGLVCVAVTALVLSGTLSLARRPFAPFASAALSAGVLGVMILNSGGALHAKLLGGAGALFGVATLVVTLGRSFVLQAAFALVFLSATLALSADAWLYLYKPPRGLSLLLFAVPPLAAAVPGLFSFARAAPFRAALLGLILGGLATAGAAYAIFVHLPPPVDNPYTSFPK